MKHMKKNIPAISCGAVFTIKHEVYDDVLYCPFCGDDELVSDVDE